MPAALDFDPLPADLCAPFDVECWTAQRGPFHYTIVTHPSLEGGFEVSVRFMPDYLPQGPFNSLEDAMRACNQTVATLEC